MSNVPTFLPDSHGENCWGVAIQLADVCCINNLVHPDDDDVNADGDNDDHDCDGDDDHDDANDEDDDEDDEDETCQRQAPTARQ